MRWPPSAWASPDCSRRHSASCAMRAAKRKSPMPSSPLSSKSPDARRLVIFGACDRHNLGDLLFPHIVARVVAADDVRVAGLVERDLREYGGHRVEAIGAL